MPELPEVESVRRGADEWFLDREISDAVIRHPRAVRRHSFGEADFVSRLRGVRLVESGRRGKYWWYRLSSDDALIVQLGMSGQVRVIDPGSAVATHERLRIVFRDEAESLQFIDQRTFGGCYLDDLAEGDVPQSITHIARDPFDSNFDQSATAQAVRRRTSAIKAVLLNQSVVSGIGNIYADETLWRARLHWATPASELSEDQVFGLLDHARDVMAEALSVGGTSFDSLYVNVNGASGYFSRALNAYGRQGQPCPRCGSVIIREQFANRSSHRCPDCQPLDGHSRTALRDGRT